MAPRSFTSFDVAPFLMWLIAYAMAGALIGLRWNLIWVGLVVGTLVGLLPSVWMGFKAHYGGILPYLALPCIIVLAVIPRSWSFWPAVCVCLIPVVVPPLLLTFRSKSESEGEDQTPPSED